MRNILTWLLIAAFGWTLSGCNTIEGAGKDIQSVGETIEDEADD